MEFSKLTAPSLKELFIDQLENMILSGKLSVGEKLPSERELADSMQVSRSVVNGGISELERKGFLEVKPRVGAYVTDYRRHGNIETLLSIMKYHGGRLRSAEIKSILEVRIALDNLAVQLLVLRVTEDEVEILRGIMTQIKTARSDKAAVHAAFAFQRELAILSGNVLVPLIFQSFRIPVFTLWERFCALYGRNALYENHYKLWEKIKDRDLPGAMAWVESSIGESIGGSRPIYY